MTRKGGKATRSSGRATRDEVARQLRDAILDGTYAAGDRLPTAEELTAQLGASYATVLRGLHILGEEGFIVARRHTGTFVTETPPHLYECALVIPTLDDPQALNQQPLFKMLRDETRASNRRTAPWRVQPWYCERDPDDPGTLALNKHQEEALASGAIAGLIFPFDPSALRGTPLLDQPGIARVTFNRVALSGVSSVTPDHRALVAGALERVQAEGCSHVAMVVCSALLRNRDLVGGETHIREEAARRGLKMRAYDLIEADRLVSETLLRRMIHVLFDRPAADRPDALVAAEDYFVPAVGAGVVDAGVNVPDDLLVLGFCSFPHRPESPVPLIRFGFDIQALFNEFVAAIERHRCGGRAAHRKLPPVFENHYS